jgi:signal transduction histidine kinase
VNPYLLVPLLSCIACAMLSVGILARDSRHPANRLGAALALASAWWGLCEVLWNGADEAEVAVRLVRLSALGWMGLGPIVLHLFLELTGRLRARRRLLLGVAYASAAAGAGLDLFTPWLHPGVVRTSWGWAYALGPAFAPVYAVAAGSLLAGLALGVHDFWASGAPGERRQARWLLVGILVPLLVASLTDGLLPLLGRGDVPRLGAASITLLAAVVAAGFGRHGYSVLAPGDFASEILAGLPDGVALLRFDGRVRSVNPGMVRLSGWTRQQLEGRPFAELVEGFPAQGERTLRTASGEGLPVAISTSTLHDKRGEVFGLVVVARDLREVVSLRKRLITSGRLAAVGELAAGIAHEINNPIAFVRSNLGGLRSLLQRVEDRLSAEELGEGRELIGESLEGVDRVAAIVRDVKGFAHAGSPQPEAVDLAPLLDSVLRVAGPELRHARVEVVHGEVPAVRGAPQELKQVFLNLVVNAAQAVERGGGVRIHTREEGERVVVSVEDEGCGIACEILERIFDPFFTTKPVGKGTGLGLSISYEIVRRHGGQMAVSSTPGRGTKVRVELPLAGLGAACEA